MNDELLQEVLLYLLEKQTKTKYVNTLSENKMCTVTGTIEVTEEEAENLIKKIVRKK